MNLKSQEMRKLAPELDPLRDRNRLEKGGAWANRRSWLKALMETAIREAGQSL